MRPPVIRRSSMRASGSAEGQCPPDHTGVRTFRATGRRTAEAVYDGSPAVALFSHPRGGRRTSATPDPTPAQRDTHFMALALRQAEASLMPDRALTTLVAFPWERGRPRTPVERSP